MGFRVKPTSGKNEKIRYSKDVKIIGGLDNATREFVSVHQQKLVENSPLLKEAFDNYKSLKQPIKGIKITDEGSNILNVVLEGTRTDDIQQIVQLMYNNKIKCSSEKKILDLFIVSEYFDFFNITPAIMKTIIKCKVHKYLASIQLNHAVAENDKKKIKECKKILFKFLPSMGNKSEVLYSLKLLSEDSMFTLVEDKSKYQLTNDELSKLVCDWVAHDINDRDKTGSELYAQLQVESISEQTKDHLKNVFNSNDIHIDSIKGFLDRLSSDVELSRVIHPGKRIASRVNTSSFSSIHENNYEIDCEREEFFHESSTENMTNNHLMPNSNEYNSLNMMKTIIPPRNRLIISEKEFSDKSIKHPQPLELSQYRLHSRCADTEDSKLMDISGEKNKEINKQEERVIIVKKTHESKNFQESKINSEVKKEKILILKKTPSPSKIRSNEMVDEYKVAETYDSDVYINEPIHSEEEEISPDFREEATDTEVTNLKQAGEFINIDKQSPSPKLTDRFNAMRLSNPYLRQSLIKKTIQPPNKLENKLGESDDKINPEGINNNDSVIGKSNSMIMQKLFLTEEHKFNSSELFQEQKAIDKTFIVLFSDDVFSTTDRSSVTISADGTKVISKHQLSRMNMLPPSVVCSSTGYAYYKKTNSVYATGGPPPSSKEVYRIVWNSPDLNSYAPDLIEGRHSHGAICHGDYIFVGGGVSEDGQALSSVEHLCILPNSSSQKWESSIQLPHPNFGLSMCSSDNGIIVIGGIGPRGTAIRDVIEYNLSSNEWNILPPMNIARAFFQCTTYNKSIYVAGGKRHADDLTMSSVEYYQLGTDDWIEITAMTCPVSHGVMMAAFDMLYVFQGINDGPIVPIDIYDMKENEWQRVMRSLHIKRVLYAAITTI